MISMHKVISTLFKFRVLGLVDRIEVIFMILRPIVVLIILVTLTIFKLIFH